MIDKKELQIAIGKRVRELREENNISQQELAAKCNIEKSNLSRLEAGGTNPTFFTLYKIAEAINVEVSDLVNI